MHGRGSTSRLLIDSRLTVRVKCSPEDTVGDLKKLIGAQTGTDHSKIQLKKWYVHIYLCISRTGMPIPVSQVHDL